MGVQYIVGLIPDPSVRNTAPTFNIASGTLVETLGDRARLLGWHEDDAGDALIEVFDNRSVDQVLADLKEADCVQCLPIPGGEPWIFEADGYTKHPDDFDKIGLTI